MSKISPLKFLALSVVIAGVAVIGFFAQTLRGSETLKVFNEYSNPILGGLWEIEFKAIGSSEDLKITTGEYTAMPDEIEFESLSCQTQPEKIYISKNTLPQNASHEILINDWDCKSNAILKFRVNDAGSHKVELTYGNLTATAHNFACDSGTLDTTCTVSTTQAMLDAETITGAGNLTIASGGNLTSSAIQSFNIIMMSPTSTVTIQSGGAITGNVTMTSFNVDVQTGGSINANGKGYAGHNTAKTAGQPATGGGGNGNMGDGGGGGHGGNGANGWATGTGGVTYDSVTNPVLYGASGGTANSGTANTSGSGGGVVIINTPGELTIDGSVTANGGNASGANSYGAGGGSGGAINITSGTITGAGTMTANGGNGVAATSGGGGGGGGIIKVDYVTKDGGYAVVPTAYGGTGGTYIGGAGIVYDVQAGTEGTLTVDNNSQSGASTTQVDESLGFDNVTISRGAVYVVDTGKSFRTDATFGATSASSEIKINGTFTAPSTLTIPANLKFTVVSGCTVSGVSTLTVDASGTFNLDSYTTSTAFDDVATVTINGTMAHTANTTAQTHVINLTATTLTVGSGGAIDVDGKGYAGHNTQNTAGSPATGGGSAGGTGDGGGGGHGGNGANGWATGTGGVTYDSVTDPVLIGASGGTANSGTANTSGSGGGLIQLNISGTLTVTGTISADATSASGANSYGAGGGSGGAINITSGTITGAGTMTANGGNGVAATNGGGGGGGGIIKVGYTTKDGGYAVVPTAYGGTGGTYIGGAGIVYDVQAGTEGTLTVDNNSQSGASTTQVDASLGFDNVTISKGAVYIVDTGKSFRTDASFGATSASSEIKINGTFTAPSTLTIPANLKFTVVSGCTVSGVSTLTVDASGTFNLDSYTTSTAFDDVATVTINGTMAHTANTTAQTHVINLTATTLTVGSGGAIDVDGKGYAGHNTQNTAGKPVTGGGGAGSTGDGGGGGHGGAGGNGYVTGAGGPAYDSVSEPALLGASGGTANSGTYNTSGSGGGLIQLNISGTLTVTGTISADATSASGTNSYGAGGGSGGAINITAGTITGAGDITANGSNGVLASNGGGGGGGGRTMIRACAFSHSGSRTVAAGTGMNNGSAGTIDLAPYCGTTLRSNDSDTSSGQTNPTNLADTTPAFSGLCNDPDVGDIINKAEIQVSTDSTFTSVTHWDSGSSGNTILDCIAGTRSADVTYGSFGTAPTLSLSTNDGAVTYYWRIKFWDDDGASGAWSTEVATFTMQDSGSLTVDIVNAEDVTTTDSVTMSALTYSHSAVQASNGTIPSGTNKIKVVNATGSPTWTLTIGPTSGTTATWSGSGGEIDFNDSGGGYTDEDADGHKGQMRINASVGTLAGVGETSTTDVTKGTNTALTGDSVTILSAGEGADSTGTWTLTGVSASQTVPAKMPASSYTIELTLTIT